MAVEFLLGKCYCFLVLLLLFNCILFIFVINCLDGSFPEIPLLCRILLPFLYVAAVCIGDCNHNVILHESYIVSHYAENTIMSIFQNLPTWHALRGVRTFHTPDYSYPRLFVLWVNYSYLGRFVLCIVRTTDVLYHRRFVRWTVRTIHGTKRPRYE